MKATKGRTARLRKRLGGRHFEFRNSNGESGSGTLADDGIGSQLRSTDGAVVDLAGASITVSVRNDLAGIQLERSGPGRDAWAWVQCAAVGEAHEIEAELSGMCEHLRYDKEYLGGMDTGDRICKDCGETFTPAR